MATDKLTVHLPGGAILARHQENLIHARGIRYAHAKRFQRPQAVPDWDGIQDCTQPAPVCPQNTSHPPRGTGVLNGNREQSEDCLHVSVVAPTSAQAAPIMAFLTGGGYTLWGGDLDAFTPHGLARKGVVVVTITYRLGIFGYLPIPKLAPANLGLLDQIEALRWVHNNIAAFGGDPENVTVFGQSAGADAIYCLLVADNTDELFHREILQSPPLGRLYQWPLYPTSSTCKSSCHAPPDLFRQLSFHFVLYLASTHCRLRISSLIASSPPPVANQYSWDIPQTRLLPSRTWIRGSHTFTASSKGKPIACFSIPRRHLAGACPVMRSGGTLREITSFEQHTV